MATVSIAAVTSASDFPRAEGGVSRMVFTASTALVTASSPSADASAVASVETSDSRRGLPPRVLDDPAVAGLRASSLRARADLGADVGATKPPGVFSSRLESATPGDRHGAFFADFAPGVRSALDTGAMSDLLACPEGAPATGGDPMLDARACATRRAGCNAAAASARPRCGRGNEQKTMVFQRLKKRPDGLRQTDFVFRC